MTTDDDATESYWNEDDEADLAYWSKYWRKDENKLRQRKASIIEFRRASARRLRAALAEEPPQPIPLPPRGERKTPEQQRQEEEQFTSFVTWGLAGCAGLVLAVCLLNQPSPSVRHAPHTLSVRHDTLSVRHAPHTNPFSLRYATSIGQQQTGVSRWDTLNATQLQSEREAQAERQALEALMDARYSSYGKGTGYGKVPSTSWDLDKHRGLSLAQRMERQAARDRDDVNYQAWEREQHRTIQQHQAEWLAKERFRQYQAEEQSRRLLRHYDPQTIPGSYGEYFPPMGQLPSGMANRLMNQPDMGFEYDWLRMQPLPR